MKKIWILKFYESQKDLDEKNPFHVTEVVGEQDEVVAQAEQIKTELKAFAYKIKTRNI